jgi:hypothetical protein
MHDDNAAPRRDRRSEFFRMERSHFEPIQMPVREVWDFIFQPRIDSASDQISAHTSINDNCPFLPWIVDADYEIAPVKVRVGGYIF